MNELIKGLLNSFLDINSHKIWDYALSKHGELENVDGFNFTKYFKM